MKNDDRRRKSTKRDEPWAWIETCSTPAILPTHNRIHICKQPEAVRSESRWLPQKSEAVRNWWLGKCAQIIENTCIFSLRLKSFHGRKREKIVLDESRSSQAWHSQVPQRASSTNQRKTQSTNISHLGACAKRRAREKTNGRAPRPRLAWYLGLRRLRRRGTPRRSPRLRPRAPRSPWPGLLINNFWVDDGGHLSIYLLTRY